MDGFTSPLSYRQRVVLLIPSSFASHALEMPRLRRQENSAVMDVTLSPCIENVTILVALRISDCYHASVKQSLGEIIGEYLKENNLKQAQFARKAGVTPMTISRCVAHGRIPTTENFQSILEAMTISKKRKIELLRLHSNFQKLIEDGKKTWGKEQSHRSAAAKVRHAYHVSICFEYKPDDGLPMTVKDRHQHSSFSECRISFKSRLHELPSFSWLSISFFADEKLHDKPPVMQQWTKQEWRGIEQCEEMEILRQIQKCVRAHHVGGVYAVACEEFEQLSREKQLEHPLDGVEHEIAIQHSLFNKVTTLVSELKALKDHGKLETFSRSSTTKGIDSIDAELRQAHYKKEAQLNQVNHLWLFFTNKLFQLK